MAREDLGKIGRCIYCGSKKDLTTEHIIPFGIGGKFILREASCKVCAKITSKIELLVLKGPLYQFRAATNLPTRHNKGKYPSTFQANVKKKNNPTTFTIEAKPDVFPLMLPIFEIPAYINKQKYSGGLTVRDFKKWHNANAVYQFLNKEELKEISGNITYEGHNFARMLAKIGYGFAVSYYGRNLIEDNFIASSIIRESNDIGMWVGNDSRRLIEPRKGSHLIDLGTEIKAEKKIILVRLQLFSFLSETPEYVVVIGPSKKADPTFRIL